MKLVTTIACTAIVLIGSIVSAMANCSPDNTEYVTPHCPAGWQIATACLEQDHWKHSKRNERGEVSWWADDESHTVCTPRYVDQKCATFCMPPEYRGNVGHKSRYNGTWATFHFDGSNKRVGCSDRCERFK